MLEANFSDSQVTHQQGAGIIFGWAHDRLYIATADHVVRQRRGPKERMATNVLVSFSFLAGERIEAKILHHVDRDLDLAVLSVIGVKQQHIPIDEIAWEVAGDSGAVKRRDQVFTIGNPQGQAWEINVTPFYVADADPTSIKFEAPSLRPGHSQAAGSSMPSGPSSV